MAEGGFDINDDIGKEDYIDDDFDETKNNF